MIDRLLTLALRQRLFVVLVALILTAWGIFAWQRLPVDAFPDVTNVQVQIISLGPGLSPLEVEQTVTFPIEVAMSGLPTKVTEIRSLSKFSLSVITVVFEDDVDLFFARQLVFERLQQAKEDLPPGVDAEMGPIASGLGEIYQYIVRGKGYSAMELRTIQDWLIRPVLRTMRGVAEVNTWGGVVKQYQVQVRPEKLLTYDLTLRDVYRAVAENNANAGGNFIEHRGEQYIVRSIGLARSLDDLKRIVVAAPEGSPVYLGDVAEIVLGPEVRQGAVTADGQGEVVTGIVMMATGQSGKEVVARVKAEVERIKPALPAGVELKPFYDRTELVEKCIETVTRALAEGIFFVLVILVLFLWHLPSALLVAMSLPLSVLMTFILMERFGLSANLMSLGGLAIGIGMLVDGTVVMVENVYRHLVEDRGRHSVQQVVLEAGKEVSQPIAFGIAIIIVVFLPLFTLEGMEGKMFAPLAVTISFALLSSLLLSLTVVPVACTFVLRGHLVERESPLLRPLKAAYRRLLPWALDHRRQTVGTAIGLLLSSLLLIPFIGTEFIPVLDEGSLAMQIFRLPSISLPASLDINGEVERALKQFPEVVSVVSRTGRAEIASDPMGVEISDAFIALTPKETWKTARTKEALVDAMREALEGIPGVTVSFTQPIQLRVDELVAGVRSQIALKIFGEDMAVLQDRAQAASRVMAQVRGTKDLRVETVAGSQYLHIVIDRAAIARHGVNVADIQEVVETAIAGKEAGQIFEGQKRFAVVVRFPEAQRNSLQAISRILISTPSGARVPLGQLARVAFEPGPVQISREQAQRRIVIEANVAGRDLGGYVAEAQQRVATQVQLPAGYRFVWGGQFENMQRAQRTLTIVVPITIFLIFLLLFTAFGSLRQAALIIINVPFALIGGIVALFISRLNLSVPASIGFIALFGVAVLNGIVLVTYINQLRQQGRSIREALLEGCLLRLRPVLMTASVAALGLVPFLFASGPGSEVQRPLAVVVIGGLISSTLLTLLVLPVLYGLFEPENNGHLPPQETKETA